MRYKLRQLPHLLANPVDRSQLRTGQMHLAWPLTRRLAALYRATAARRVTLAAVVGSLGKTTAARASSVALGIPLHPGMGLNDKAFLPFQLLRIKPTQQRAVVEVGIDRPGQMRQFAAMVRPNIALVTAIGAQHKRSLKTVLRTRDEKAEMVRALPADGWAVLNADDPNVLWMAGQTHAQVLTYGRAESADIRLVELREDFPYGLQLEITTPFGRATLLSQLAGPHMAYPLLGAVAVAQTAGVSLEQACDRLTAMSAAPGRMEVIQIDCGATLVCDYSTSTLDTVEASLDFLAGGRASRKFVVFGDVTEIASSAGAIYRNLGAKVAACADFAVFYGEKTQPYKTGALRAGMASANILVADKDLGLVTRWLQEHLQQGDVVLLKARHHQRFDRIALALRGRTVGCRLSFCRAAAIECATCSKLESGWGDRTAVL